MSETLMSEVAAFPSSVCKPSAQINDPILVFSGYEELDQIIVALRNKQSQQGVCFSFVNDELRIGGTRIVGEGLRDRRVYYFLRSENNVDKKYIMLPTGEDFIYVFRNNTVYIVTRDAMDLANVSGRSEDSYITSYIKGVNNDLYYYLSYFDIYSLVVVSLDLCNHLNNPTFITNISHYVSSIYESNIQIRYNKEFVPKHVKKIGNVSRRLVDLAYLTDARVVKKEDVWYYQYGELRIPFCNYDGLRFEIVDDNILVECEQERFLFSPENFLTVSNYIMNLDLTLDNSTGYQKVLYNFHTFFTSVVLQEIDQDLLLLINCHTFAPEEIAFKVTAMRQEFANSRLYGGSSAIFLENSHVNHIASFFMKPRTLNSNINLYPTFGTWIYNLGDYHFICMDISQNGEFRMSEPRSASIMGQLPIGIVLKSLGVPLVNIEMKKRTDAFGDNNMNCLLYSLSCLMCFFLKENPRHADGFSGEIQDAVAQLRVQDIKDFVLSVNFPLIVKMLCHRALRELYVYYNIIENKEIALNSFEDYKNFSHAPNQVHKAMQATTIERDSFSWINFDKKTLYLMSAFQRCQKYKCDMMHIGDGVVNETRINDCTFTQVEQWGQNNSLRVMWAVFINSVRETHKGSITLYEAFNNIYQLEVEGVDRNTIMVTQMQKALRNLENTNGAKLSKDIKVKDAVEACLGVFDKHINVPVEVDMGSDFSMDSLRYCALDLCFINAFLTSIMAFDGSVLFDCPIARRQITYEFRDGKFTSNEIQRSSTSRDTSSETSKKPAYVKAEPSVTNSGVLVLLLLLLCFTCALIVEGKE